MARSPVSGAGECARKARKGLIRVRLVIGSDGSIRDAEISGDFFIYPEDLVLRIEEELRGRKIDDVDTSIRKLLSSAYMPGIDVNDIVETVKCAYRRAVEGSA